MTERRWKLVRAETLRVGDEIALCSMYDIVLEVAPNETSTEIEIAVRSVGSRTVTRHTVRTGFQVERAETDAERMAREHTRVKLQVAAWLVAAALAAGAYFAFMAAQISWHL